MHGKEKTAGLLLAILLYHTAGKFSTYLLCIFITHPNRICRLKPYAQKKYGPIPFRGGPHKAHHFRFKGEAIKDVKRRHIAKKRRRDGAAFVP